MPEVKVQLRQVGPTTSESTMPRGHTTLVDRPEAKGGNDEGPMGGEYFLTGVGGCFMSTLLAAINAREAPVTNVRAEVTGTLEDTPPRFTSVTVQVSADCDDPELLEKLVQVAENGCIMVNSLKRGIDFGVSAGATVEPSRRNWGPPPCASVTRPVLFGLDDPRLEWRTCRMRSPV